MPHFHSTEPREIVNISGSKTDIHMQFFLKVHQDDFRKSQGSLKNLELYFKGYSMIYVKLANLARVDPGRVKTN